MFCFQCQEAAKGIGCTNKGVCGKTEEVANLQDLLVYSLKGLAYYTLEAKKLGMDIKAIQSFIHNGLFTTITNVNFDPSSIRSQIQEALRIREEVSHYLKSQGKHMNKNLPDCATWKTEDYLSLESKAREVGILNTNDEDIRSLRELILYGLKGISAYSTHANTLGYNDESIDDFLCQALVKTIDDTLTFNDLVQLTLETGKHGVKVMALLDKANTETYGNPELTKVNIGVRNNPAILISGHDLKDMEELLQQTKGTGVDVYTHCEMLPANYYPAFKKYDHFVGNYGSSWWNQNKEFESFNGPILMTTNCIVPPKESYINRLFTTGSVGYAGVTHIPNAVNGESKDFSLIIDMAKKCNPPTEIESGEIMGGFAHHQVLSLADKVVDAVKSGAIKKFVVMAGCDGRQKSRQYYTDFAGQLPKDSVILTAGCAKYRYNKLPLGDIQGIPRVLDAGQCNDSYSLALIALKLQEVFELDDINQLPIAYNIAWYEQKAVIVLLALLSLGVKNIHLGPSLPAFLSEKVVEILVDTFNISGIEDVEKDMAMMG